MFMSADSQIRVKAYDMKKQENVDTENSPSSETDRAGRCIKKLLPNFESKL